MTKFRPTYGRFPGDHVRFVIATAALILAAVTGSGPDGVMNVVSFAQFLLPPDGGRGPGRPAT